MNPFEINFTYQGFPFSGLVEPKEENGLSFYTVHVESENQESHLDIVANPCGNDKMDWCFKNPETDSSTSGVDKDFLVEIGEAIEKAIIN